MSITTDIKISASFTKTTYTIDPFSTTTAVQQNAFSVAIPVNKAVYAVVQFVCNNSTYTNASGGSVMAVFLRAAGNVSRTATSTATGLIASILSNFLVVQPTVDIAANTTTQNIDLNVTGLASTTLGWHLELTVYMSN